MKAYFTRDSVAAGDDGDAPHAVEIAVPDGMTVEQLVRTICQAAKLPSITGGKATWCLASRVPLAVIAQQWPAPRMIGLMPPKLSDLDADAKSIRLHFSYFAQQDPDTVFEVLRRLRLWAE